MGAAARRGRQGHEMFISALSVYVKSLHSLVRIYCRSVCACSAAFLRAANSTGPVASHSLKNDDSGFCSRT